MRAIIRTALAYTIDGDTDQVESLTLDIVKRIRIEANLQMLRIFTTALENIEEIEAGWPMITKHHESVHMMRTWICTYTARNPSQ